MSKEAKQERLEKMIREELIENSSDRVSPGAPGVTYRSSTSLRQQDDLARVSSGMKNKQ